MDIVAPDEDFANNLYANWDDFSRDCLERIIDEYFSSYDRDKVFYEIEELDLDLGSIPEDEFYKVFPQKLKEELIKKVSVGHLSPADTSSTSFLRLDNLLFYLVHGCNDVDWAELTGLDDDLEWIEKQSDSFIQLAIGKIVDLCLSDETALYRLLLQSDHDLFLLKIFVSMLNRAMVSEERKLHVVSVFFEKKPEIIVHFIHATSDSQLLRLMAEKIDSQSVWSMMKSESEGLVRTSVLAFWHQLYKWLVDNYLLLHPAFGGSEKEFVFRLNQCLLTFIRKRSLLSCMSNIELTRIFFHEIFGTALYGKMVNILEELRTTRLQDASVQLDASEKLYTVFHDLYVHEVLRGELPTGKVLSSDVTKEADKTQDKLRCESREHAASNNEDALISNQNFQQVYNLFDTHWSTVQGFASWITDSSVSVQDKRKLIYTAVVQHIYRWIALLGVLKQNKGLIELIAALLPVSVLQQGLMEINVTKAFILSALVDYLNNHVLYKFISDGDPKHKQQCISQAILLYLQNEDMTENPITVKQVTERFCSYLYEAHTDSQNYHSDFQWQKQVDQLVSEMEHKIPDSGLIGEHINVIDAQGQQTYSIPRILQENREDKTVSLPDFLLVKNAGLCLLAPWFVHLFSMLGYLDDEHKDFKDIESRVKAIFLLQYLVYGKENKYAETELAFNRLITALPGYIPLPTCLALSPEEIETADSMIRGVKANWTQMSGTSVEGFRQSFICRNGTLEQEDERWILKVDHAAYDMLLDTVPWGFRQIRLPWLKKYVQVNWHEKQMFY